MNFYQVHVNRQNNSHVNFHHVMYNQLNIDAFTGKTISPLKRDSQFRLTQLHNHIYVDHTLIDNLDITYRFSLIYILLQRKMKLKRILNFGLKTTFNVIAQTISNIFYAIGPAEREVYDLFGVAFKNHPDLRRVVSDYGFRGNPLKKDFPLTGTVEIFFSISKKILVFRPIKFVQELRIFHREAPWNDSIEDFFNEPKSEQEDDNEMASIIITFCMFLGIFDLNWTNKNSTKGPPGPRILDLNKKPILPKPMENKLDQKTDNQITPEMNTSGHNDLLAKSKKFSWFLFDGSADFKSYLIARNQKISDVQDIPNTLQDSPPPMTTTLTSLAYRKHYRMFGLNNYKNNPLTPLRNDLAEEIQTLTPIKNNLEEKIQTLTPLRYSLEEEIQTLTPVRNNLEGEIRVLTPIKNNLEEKIEILTPIKNSLEEDIEILTPIKNNLKSEIKILTPVRNNLEKDIDNFNNTVNRNNSNLNPNVLLEQKEARINFLENKLIGLRKLTNKILKNTSQNLENTNISNAYNKLLLALLRSPSPATLNQEKVKKIQKDYDDYEKKMNNLLEKNPAPSKEEKLLLIDAYAKTVQDNINKGGEDEYAVFYKKTFSVTGTRENVFFQRIEQDLLDYRDISYNKDVDAYTEARKEFLNSIGKSIIYENCNHDLNDMFISSNCDNIFYYIQAFAEHIENTLHPSVFSAIFRILLLIYQHREMLKVGLLQLKQKLFSLFKK